jgi:hypothetical protein
MLKKALFHPPTPGVEDEPLPGRRSRLGKILNVAHVGKEPVLAGSGREGEIGYACGFSEGCGLVEWPF